MSNPEHRKSSFSLDQLLSAMPIPTFCCDAASEHMVAANEEFRIWIRDVCGTEPRNHNQLEDWISSDLQFDLARAIAGLRSEVVKKTFHKSITSKNGVEIVYTISVSRLPAGFGEENCFLVGLLHGRNETLEQREKDESFQMLRTMIDILPAFMYAKDKEGKFIIANEVVAAFMGCASPDELIGKSDFDYYPRSYALKYYGDEQEVIQTGRPRINYLESTTLEDGRGEPMWINTTKVPLRDKAGEIIGIVGTGFDVTTRKKTDDQLRELQEIVNHSNSVAFLMTSEPNWPVNYCSKTVSLFGYSCDDFLKGSRDFLDIIHPEELETVREEVEKRMAEETSDHTQEFRIKTKNGGYCWVEAHFHIRHQDEKQDYCTFRVVLTDVSRRHKYRKERDEMEIQLRQAQKLEAVGQLAAGIAHEINTPVQFIGDNLRFLADSIKDLNGMVLSMSESLDAEGDKLGDLKERFIELKTEVDFEFLLDEIPKAIEQSLEGTDRVTEIVKAMKEFSHPGTGEISPEDINAAIRNTVAVARNEWKYVAEVDLKLEETLPLVPVDIGPFKQTVLNLIVNAAHAIEDRVNRGDYKIGQIVVETASDETWVRIQVSDTGTGMPEDIAQRAFDPFFTTKDVGKGTGQGLAMAYDIIVRKLKGKLHFDTRVNEGTTFTIDLPMLQ